VKAKYVYPGYKSGINGLDIDGNIRYSKKYRLNEKSSRRLNSP